MRNYTTGTKHRDTTNLQNILRGASGPMKHRCEPKGGSFNDQAEFLNEYEEFKDNLEGEDID